MGRPPPLDWWKWSSGHWTQMNTWLPKPTNKLLPFTKRMGIRLHKIDGLHGVDEWGPERRHDGYKGRSLFWSFPWIFPSDSATLNCLLDVEFWFFLGENLGLQPCVFGVHFYLWILFSWVHGGEASGLCVSVPPMNASSIGNPLWLICGWTTTEALFTLRLRLRADNGPWNF